MCSFHRQVDVSLGELSFVGSLSSIEGCRFSLYTEYVHVTKKKL